MELEGDEELEIGQCVEDHNDGGDYLAATTADHADGRWKLRIEP